MALMPCEHQDTPLKIKTITYNVPASSQSIAIGGMFETVVNITETGYKPVGLLGINKVGTGNSFLVLVTYVLDTGLYISLRNVATGMAVTLSKVEFTILYAKDEFISSNS